MYKEHVDAIKIDSKLKLIIIPSIIAAIAIFAPGIFQLLFSLVFPAPITEISSLPAALGMATTLILATIAMAKISNINYRDLGILKENIAKQTIIGVIGGFSLLAFVVSTIWLFGATKLIPNPNHAAFAMLVGLLFFLCQGTWEELIYRSYLMPHFEKVMGSKASIIVTSVLFTAFHGLNPGMKLLPIINLFIASVVFSLIYYYTGSLIVVGIGHGVWNYTQGFIFGAEVSGNTVSNSIFMAKAQQGYDLISGGAFGFEGGLITSITGLILIVLFIFLIKNRKENN